jgi:hypothetical protein
LLTKRAATKPRQSNPRITVKYFMPQKLFHRLADGNSASGRGMLRFGVRFRNTTAENAKSAEGTRRVGKSKVQGPKSRVGDQKAEVRSGGRGRQSDDERSRAGFVIGQHSASRTPGVGCRDSLDLLLVHFIKNLLSPLRQLLVRRIRAREAKPVV